MKGTEVPNPRHSSACDCTCVLTRIDHCGHTFLRHIDLLNSIACIMVFNGKWNHKTSCSKQCDRILSLRTRYTETVHVNKMADFVYKLSSFRENNCLVIYTAFLRVAVNTSHWMPKSARRQNRENGDTHTHTHTHTYTHRPIGRQLL